MLTTDQIGKIEIKKTSQKYLNKWNIFQIKMVFLVLITR
jgi:hypothetical protein